MITHVSTTELARLMVAWGFHETGQFGSDQHTLKRAGVGRLVLPRDEQADRLLLLHAQTLLNQVGMSKQAFLEWVDLGTREAPIERAVVMLGP